MSWFPVSGLGIYLLKMGLISLLLFGYYRLFLHNRSFHQYNRYYLLGVIPLSLTLPLITLPSAYPIWVKVKTPTLFGAWHSIVPGDWKEQTDLSAPSKLIQHFPEWQELALVIYLLLAALLICSFFRQLRYIRRLSDKYSREKIGDIDFFMTHEPGTPFTFLNTIFWNDQMDINSSLGRQVFQHELYHIRQKHTLDLLSMKTILILFWFNPIFYLIYREIRTLHEFLADRFALSGGDKYQYAELLVWHTIYSRPSSLLHPFFHSSIKRRITMITQLKSATSGTMNRVMALPLLLLLLCAFAGRPHPHRGPQTMSTLKPFTVVIDAGHGGADPGAVTGRGIQEKNINLALALKIKQLSSEYQVNVALTREDDELAGNKNSVHESLVYRTAFAKKANADLFVSIHTDAVGGSNLHGFTVYLSSQNHHYPECVTLSSPV